eukprot:334228_1
MTLSYSNIVSISYFAVYTLFLFVLGYIVYKQGGHESIKSKSYIKDLWAQRKIYAPLLVYFYDTASDIGVIIFWYELMMDEKNGIRDYNSVNMELFFWFAISFMLLYRIVMIIAILYYYFTDEGDLYDVILVLLDIYIFKAVYISFDDARETISDNAEKRKKKQQTKNPKKQKETQTQMEIEMTPSNTQTISDLDEYIVQEIEPADVQQTAQLAEAVFEAMPQIILQSIFVIRSANDKELAAASSNDILIMLSIIASLFSVSNKFISSMDVEDVVDKAKSLKPRQTCPGCIQYWYIIRVLWRIFNIMSRFVVYVLIWTVIGGAWLPIWFGLVWFMWIIVLHLLEHQSLLESVFGAVIATSGVLLYQSVKPHLCKYIENIIGLTIITIFTLIEFDCWKCSNAKERQMTNNNRIMIFLIMGWGSLFGEIVLFIAIKVNQIIINPF